MKMKEPARKHKIPVAGERWIKREMRKPFRIMFWVLVVLMGVGLVGNLMMFLDSKNEVTTNSVRQRKKDLKDLKKLQIGEEGILVGDTQFPVGKYETVYWKDRVAGEDSWGEVYVVPSGTRVLVIGKSNRDPTVTKVRILSEEPHQNREYWFSNKYILRKR
jgi:hypothetical protein